MSAGRPACVRSLVVCVSERASGGLGGLEAVVIDGHNNALAGRVVYFGKPTAMLQLCMLDVIISHLLLCMLRVHAALSFHAVNISLDCDLHVIIVLSHEA